MQMVMSMRISNIHWLSQVAFEAEVEVTDGEFFCVAFSQPCSVGVGDELTELLHVFGIKEVMLSEQSQVGISSVTVDGLGRKVVARVDDKSRQILAVGAIAMVVDEYLPGGFEDGDLIEFECARIDLW
ncbi:hypothetical protein [Solilutibacter silvestris]|uniref:hypothetical protein n=1 Tax=Solilutibacter silvestris TaxID=1645665 RepID=UPI003D34F4D8